MTDTRNIPNPSTKGNPAQNPTLDPNKNQVDYNPVEANKVSGHTVVADNDKLSKSGKNVGLVDAPIVTMHKTSTPIEKEKPNYKTLDDVGDIFLKNKDHFNSKFIDTDELDVESGVFIPIEPNKTIDQLMFDVEAEVYRLNEYYSIPAHNEEGEEILDQVMIREFKRNEDKTIQLDGKDEPITGANSTFIKRRIQLRQYVAISVTKDDEKIDSDGALIIRVF